MFYYLIKIGAAADVSQQEVLDILKSAGDDLIQTSGGLCLKTDKAIEEIRNTNEKLKNLTIMRVELHEESEELSDDVRAFINKGTASTTHEVAGP